MTLSEQIQRPTRSGRSPMQTAVTYAKVKSKLPFPVKLYFLSLALPLEFNAGTILLTGVRTLLLVLFIPMLLKLLLGRYGRLIWTDFLFFLFCPWVIYTLHLNTPDEAFSFGGSVGIEFYGGYLLGRAYIRTPEAFAGMCKALFLVITATLPFAIYETQTGHAPIPEMLNKIPGFFSLVDFYNEAAGMRMGLERAQVIFEHPIHYGLFCSTAFALAYTGFKGQISTPMRYLLGLIVSMGVFFSVSSGAMLPMILQFILIFWAWALDKVSSRWTILMVLTAIAYVVVDAISNRTPIQVFLSYAMKNVWMHPLYGLGLNDWVREWFMHGSSVDNFWLLNTMRYGIPGFALIALGFALPIWNIAWHPIAAGSTTWLFRRAWMITWVGLVLTLCTVDVWAAILSYVGFLFGAGIWFLSVEQTTDGTPKETGRRAPTSRNVAQPQSNAAGAADLPVADSASRFTRFTQTRR
jgi:hypothetical protein